ncbi:MAG TPA: Flp family type IVb pilin [Bryobacteraceae bacterium]|nr:Flp family type IVb pilin [Bryobacteraceae bacterium]
MMALVNGIWKLKMWSDARGQDLVEYALVAGFMVTAAAAISPAIGGSVSTVFSGVVATLAGAGSEGTNSGHL